jgi:predicted TIM-barrel fold metal-dependent hydrolase
MSGEDTRRSISETLAEAVRAKICHGNAERLLQL